MFSADTMLRHHLQHNHFPPVDPAKAAWAAAAIQLADAGDWHAVVRVDGLTLQDDHGNVATAADLVESWHLDGFLDMPGGLPGVSLWLVPDPAPVEPDDMEGGHHAHTASPAALRGAPGRSRTLLLGLASLVVAIAVGIVAAIWLLMLAAAIRDVIR